MESELYLDRLKHNIYNTGKVHLTEEVCLVWTGARLGNTLYGKKSITLPGTPGRRYYFRLHRLVYALYYLPVPQYAVDITARTLTPPLQDEDQKPLDVSHICHLPNYAYV